MKKSNYLKVTILIFLLGFAILFLLANVIPQDSANPIPWYVSRAAAITAYILMFLMIVMGEGLTVGYTYRFLNPITAWVIHKYLGIALGISILVHVFSLLFDKFINFGALELFIPFYSSYQTLYLSLGIIAFYVLAAIIITSLPIRERTPFFWQNIHYFTYPFFIFAFIHGLFIGTDSATLLMKMLYWTTGLLFAVLSGYRVFVYKNKLK